MDSGSGGGYGAPPGNGAPPQYGGGYGYGGYAPPPMYYHPPPPQYYAPPPPPPPPPDYGTGAQPIDPATGQPVPVDPNSTGTPGVQGDPTSGDPGGAAAGGKDDRNMILKACCRSASSRIGSYLLGVAFAGAEAGLVYEYLSTNNLANATVSSTNAYVQANCTSPTITPSQQTSCNTFIQQRQQFVNAQQTQAQYYAIGAVGLVVIGAAQAIMADPPGPDAPDPKAKKKKDRKYSGFTEVDPERDAQMSQMFQSVRLAAP